MLSLDNLPKLSEEERKNGLKAVLALMIKEHIKEQDYYRRHPEEI